MQPQLPVRTHRSDTPLTSAGHFLPDLLLAGCELRDVCVEISAEQQFLNHSKFPKSALHHDAPKCCLAIG